MQGSLALQIGEGVIINDYARKDRVIDQIFVAWTYLLSEWVHFQLKPYSPLSSHYSLIVIIMLGLGTKVLKPQDLDVKLCNLILLPIIPAIKILKKVLKITKIVTKATKLLTFIYLMHLSFYK